MSRFLPRLASLLLPSILVCQPLLVEGQDSPPDHQPYTTGQMVVRAGVTGRIWSPKGFEPYSLDGYSRGALYGSFSLRHPFQRFGETWDVIDIPEIAWHDNGSEARFQPEQGVFPQESGEYSNSGYSLWGVLGGFLSLRYDVDRYQAKFLDERAAFEDLLEDPGRYIRVWETWTRRFDIGIIGTPADAIETTELEIGYYRVRLQWPLIDWNREERFSDVGGLYLIQEDLITEGFYGIIHTEPIEGVWPLQSRLRVQVGGIFGISLFFRLEQRVWSDLYGGFDFEGEWRTLNNARDRFDTSVDLRSRSPRETRLRTRLFLAWRFL